MRIPDQSQKKFHRELPPLLGFGGLWQMLLYLSSMLRDCWRNTNSVSGGSNNGCCGTGLLHCLRSRNSLRISCNLDSIALSDCRRPSINGIYRGCSNRKETTPGKFFEI